MLNASQAAWSRTVPLTSPSSAPASTAPSTGSPAPKAAAHRTNAWLYVAGAAALALLVVAYNAHCRQYPLACSGGGGDCPNDNYNYCNIANNISDSQRKRAPAIGLSFIIR
ncbi:MAG: hypothetical protein WBD74_09315 [Candidatus Aquilonibacter sp.]